MKHPLLGYRVTGVSNSQELLESVTLFRILSQFCDCYYTYTAQWVAIGMLAVIRTLPVHKSANDWFADLCWGTPVTLPPQSDQVVVGPPTFGPCAISLTVPLIVTGASNLEELWALVTTTMLGTTKTMGHIAQCKISQKSAWKGGLIKLDPTPFRCGRATRLGGLAELLDRMAPGAMKPRSECR